MFSLRLSTMFHLLRVNEHLYLPKQATRQTENRLYAQENKRTHDNKITEMNTNMEHKLVLKRWPDDDVA